MDKTIAMRKRDLMVEQHTSELSEISSKSDEIIVDNQSGVRH